MLYAIAAVLILIADQWLKYWVTANIVLNTGSKDLIPGVLKLVNIHNDGAAFSLFSGARWFFVALCVVFVAVVVWALITHKLKSGFGRWTAVLAVAGAVGNGIDRVMYGYVVDMFVVPPVKILQVFNIADIFITVCGLLFCVYLIFGGKEKTAHHGKAKAAAHGHTRSTQPERAAAAPRHEVKKARHAPGHEAQPRPEEDEIDSAAMDEGAARPQTPPPAKPAAAPAQKPASSQSDDMDFSLDDILNEFK